MSHFMLFSLLSACCTIVGAVPALLIRHLSHRSKDVLLAYTAGIMVAASTYGMIPSALRLSNLFVLCVGVMLGTLLLTVMETFDSSHRPGSYCCSWRTAANTYHDAARHDASQHS